MVIETINMKGKIGKTAIAMDVVPIYLAYHNFDGCMANLIKKKYSKNISKNYIKCIFTAKYISF